MIYAGIDEAGYGPIFGPLVIARAVFRLEGCDPALPPPSLWKRLQGAVCRAPGDARDRIAVCDSKALYTPAAGLRHLERGVLAFLAEVAGRPGTLEDLLAALAPGSSPPIGHPCYLDPTGGPSLPVQLSPERLGESAALLRRACQRTGARLVEAGAAVVFEDRFNELVGSCGNKARCAWTFVAEHLRSIWDRYGEEHPHVVVDRQGGRIYYLELLADLFPQAHLCIHEETAPLSRYELSEGTRKMHVTVQVGSERRHLPAAFASMSAKYLRELLMMRFQAFWRTHAPQVRPTWGYHRDGRRFLREIEPLLPGLRLERELLVRRC